MLALRFGHVISWLVTSVFLRASTGQAAPCSPFFNLPISLLLKPREVKPGAFPQYTAETVTDMIRGLNSTLLRSEVNVLDADGVNSHSC